MADKSDKDYGAEMDAIKNDVKVLREDVAALLGAFGDDLESRGENVRRNAEKRIRDVQDRAQERVDALERTLEQNPLGALGAALGIGFLIGALFSRR